jgi:hypothetical protein
MIMRFLDRLKEKGERTIKIRDNEWVLMKDTDDEKVWVNQYNGSAVAIMRIGDSDKFYPITLVGGKKTTYGPVTFDGAMDFIEGRKMKWSAAFGSNAELINLPEEINKRRKKSTKPKFKRCKCKVK